MKLRVNMILFILFLIACASHNEIVQKDLTKDAEQFVGKHKDQLLLKKGVPDMKDSLSNGNEVWTYRNLKVGKKKGMTVTIGNGNNSDKPLISWTEGLNFIISNDGIVKEYTVNVK